MSQDAPLLQAARELVRQASLEPRLAGLGELLAGLGEQGLLENLTEPERLELGPKLAGLLAQEPDIASFTGLDSERKYHLPELLSSLYARILDRKADALSLVAEEVRANSRDYPRPLRLELFEAKPFELPPSELSLVLKEMAASRDYQDISFTESPEGAIYLFSTRYLSRNYARYLAGRDEGLADNP